MQDEPPACDDENTGTFFHIAYATNEFATMKTTDVIANSAATSHIFSDKTCFESYEAIEPIHINTAVKGISFNTIGIGAVLIMMTYKNKSHNILLTNVLHAPEVQHNLISTAKLDESDMYCLQGNGQILFIINDKVIGSATYIDYTYIVNCSFP